MVNAPWQQIDYPIVCRRRDMEGINRVQEVRVRSGSQCSKLGAGASNGFIASVCGHEVDLTDGLRILTVAGINIIAAQEFRIARSLLLLCQRISNLRHGGRTYCTEKGGTRPSVERSTVAAIGSPKKLRGLG